MALLMKLFSKFNLTFGCWLSSGGYNDRIIKQLVYRLYIYYVFQCFGQKVMDGLNHVS